MITPYIGKSIDEPFEEQGHSKRARLTFNELKKVGVIKGHKEGAIEPEGMNGKLECKLNFDYSKGLLW